jgi:HAE1 family hydrophobic/amphiphilic exporter-1
LSPALAALLLKPKKEQKGMLARFFASFNRMFDRFTNGYVKVAGFFARKLIISLIILGGIVACNRWARDENSYGICSGRRPGIFHHQYAAS